MASECLTHWTTWAGDSAFKLLVPYTSYLDNTGPIKLNLTLCFTVYQHNTTILLLLLREDGDCVFDAVELVTVTVYNTYRQNVPYTTETHYEVCTGRYLPGPTRHGRPGPMVMAALRSRCGQYIFSSCSLVFLLLLVFLA